MINERTLHIVCDCHHPEHQFDLSYFDDENDSVYLTIHLAKQPLLRRIWYAIRYVLGRQSRYGAFDEIVISPVDTRRIADFCLSFWVRYASTMKFDSMKDDE